MKTRENSSYNRKFAEVYEMVMENGNTALKPLAPLPARPNLYLVPKTDVAEAREDAPCRPHSLSKYILGFVGLACLFALLGHSGALVGDLLGCGAVAYFATRSLVEE
ncbi:MAG: hypothetical protein IJN74_03365 [Clostridia bacterium]|nr:hypothetical protein [Clostridia bacterium]